MRAIRRRGLRGCQDLNSQSDRDSHAARPRDFCKPQSSAHAGGPPSTLPDAATNTPLIGPRAARSSRRSNHVRDPEDRRPQVSHRKLPIEASWSVPRVSKEFEELCDDRARPVERLRDAYGGFGDELSLPQILRARWLLGQGQNVEGDLSYQGAWHDFVHVSDAYLGDDGLKRLAKALSNGAFPRLMFMCLGGNEIGDEGLSALGEAAANGGLARLFDLVLDDNRIGGLGLLQPLVALAHALPGSAPRVCRSSSVRCWSTSASIATR